MPLLTNTGATTIYFKTSPYKKNKMKKSIQIILILLFTFTVGNAQSNWYAHNNSITPFSNPIYSNSDVTLSVDFTWYSTSPFINDNHLARLVVAYPYALDSSTGIPSVTINGNSATNVSFAFLGGGWTCNFSANTIFLPNTIINFSITGINVNDYVSYTNQPCTFFIDFISAPAETSQLDNVTVLFFNTVAEGVPMEIDTTKQSEVIKHDVVLYQNPFTNILYLKFHCDKKSVVEYLVFDIFGRKVSGQTEIVNKGNNILEVNTSGFSEGFYYIKVSLNGSIIKNSWAQKI